MHIQMVTILRENLKLMCEKWPLIPYKIAQF